MREIEIETYQAHGFSTPEAAIAHAKSSPLLAKAKAEESLILGSSLIDASWNDTEFIVRFSNDQYLHVFVDPQSAKDEVQWRIGDQGQQRTADEMERVGSPPVLLKFPRSGSYQMDRSALIAVRRGREIKNLFAGDIGLLLYTSKQQILRFSCVFRQDNHRNLLYVSEID